MGYNIDLHDDDNDVGGGCGGCRRCIHFHQSSSLTSCNLSNVHSDLFKRHIDDGGGHSG